MYYHSDLLGLLLIELKVPLSVLISYVCFSHTLHVLYVRQYMV